MTNPMISIIYCRKSSEAEDRQILSIESQDIELKKLAERDGFSVAKIFHESQSAKEPGRPVFNEMVALINKSKEPINIIVWKLDRLARNPVDGGTITWLLQKEVIAKITTPDRIYYPSDNALIAAVEFGMANQYVRDLSANVKRGNRTKLERGEWPNRAPTGYKNDKNTKSIVLDPKLAPFVIRGFDLYVNQRYSVENAAKILKSEGSSITRSALHRIFQNPFYIGLMLSNGKLYKGNHKPLISRAIFDKANEILNARNSPRPSKRFFPLRGMVICDKCGCFFTANIKKGHDYYYCTEGRGNCDEHKHYLREDELYGFIGDIFGSLAVSPELIDIAYEAAKEKLTEANKHAEIITSDLDRELKNLEEAGSKLLDAYLSGVVSKAVFEAKTSEIEGKKLALEIQLDQRKKQDRKVTLELTKEVFLSANRAKKEFSEAEGEKKRMIAQKLLWNLRIRNQKPAQYLLKTPYDILAEGGKITTLSQLLPDLDSNQDTMLQRHESYH